MSSKGFAMRKIMISLLMASAAVMPTLAFAQDSPADRRAAREQSRAERQAAREDRAATRQIRAVPSEDRSVQRAERQAPAQVAPVDRRGAIDTRPIAVRAGDSAAARGARQAEPRDVRQARFQAMRAARRNAGPPPVSRTPQPNTQPPPPATSRPTVAPSWNTSWRNNSRYNWYNYRNKHRWLFNLGFYYDPFGWSYSPFSIGYRMWPSYYSSSYWLNDPWQYRLPYAPPGTRWIRYYDDAILVDMWSGQVIDVIYDFFW